MKQLFTLGFLLFALQGFARNNYLCIKDPTNGSSGYQTPGNLKDVSIEVTPKGIYAQVDLIFTISIPSGRVGDLEGILCFDLPAGSFIQESWLWLNDTTIINADIIEREKAIQIYTGIVRKQRDPSLLVKNLTSQYRLNVYPIRTNYARKVKITYTTPFVWQNDKASIILPTALLHSSDYPPAFTLKVNTNATLDTPSFLNLPFASYITAQNSGSYTLNIPGADYRNNNGLVSDLHLAYKNNMGANTLVYAYSTSANEGVYQLVMPAAMPTANAPKSILYIIDQFGPLNQQQNNMTYSMPDIVRFLKNSLVRDLKPTDSFNIIYSNGTSIVKASPTWRAADLWGINSVIGNIALTGNTQGPQLRNLLRTALPIAQSKAGAQSVLIGCDQLYSTANYADTMFTNLRTFLGGFTNRIDVVNNSNNATSSEYFYNKLCLATGGNQYTNSGKYNDTYINNTSIDLDLDVCIRQICGNAAQSTTAFNTILPLNGIAYSEYEPTMSKMYNPTVPFAQVGRYYGTWPATGNIQVNYVSATGIQSGTSPIPGINPGSASTYKSWLFNYMNELKSLNGIGSYKTALIDSSIRNRVLHDYTAFLALETGDTVRGNPNPIILDVAVAALKEEGISLAPNPFMDFITISCKEEIAQLQIMDVTGRLIWEAKSPRSKQVIWRGNDASGTAVNPGIYIVSIIDKLGNRHTAKVEKR